MASFYDELQPEEWPSYARPSETQAVTLKVDEFLDATFEATVVSLLHSFRHGEISLEELAYLLQEAATWFDILLD